MRRISHRSAPRTALPEPVFSVAQPHFPCFPCACQVMPRIPWTREQALAHAKAAGVRSGLVRAARAHRRLVAAGTLRQVLQPRRTPNRRLPVSARKHPVPVTVTRREPVAKKASPDLETGRRPNIGLAYLAPDSTAPVPGQAQPRPNASPCPSPAPVPVQIPPSPVPHPAQPQPPAWLEFD